jgi:integrase
MIKEYELIPLFIQLIRHLQNGKRTNTEGKKVRSGTLTNYKNTLRLFKLLEEKLDEKLIILELKGSNKREFLKVRKHYEALYKNFTGFLYKDLNYFDNTVGSNIKTLRAFFNWLNRHKNINTGLFYKDFIVQKEEIAILTLSLEQLKLLIFDKEFEDSLPDHLQRTKDLFVIGCTTGLRFSDLRNLKKSNILYRDGQVYLNTKTKKTGTDVLVKLPDYAESIFRKYTKVSKSFLPAYSLNRFNNNVKKIGELAGWTQPFLKQREQNGKTKEFSKRNKDGKPLRFCDMLSSHTMRRTAITSYLMLGMPEHFVRRISGHSGNSKAFYRYVALAQTIMDTEIEKAHSKIRDATFA